MSNEVPYRPFSRIQEMLTRMQLEITYAYEDLIFVDRNAFLLQMGDVGSDVTLFINSEADKGSHFEIIAQLTRAAAEYGLLIRHGGTFTMTQGADEQIDISFSPA